MNESKENFPTDEHSNLIILLLNIRISKTFDQDQQTFVTTNK